MREGDASIRKGIYYKGEQLYCYWPRRAKRYAERRGSSGHMADLTVQNELSILNQVIKEKGLKHSVTMHIVGATWGVMWHNCGHWIRLEQMVEMQT